MLSFVLKVWFCSDDKNTIFIIVNSPKQRFSLSPLHQLSVELYAFRGGTVAGDVVVAGNRIVHLAQKSLADAAALLVQRVAQRIRQLLHTLSHLLVGLASRATAVQPQQLILPFRHQLEHDSFGVPQESCSS